MVDPDEPGGWTWYSYHPDAARSWSSDGMLPTIPVLTLAGGHGGPDLSYGVRIDWREYDTRADAERALLEAWPDDVTEVPS